MSYNLNSYRVIFNVFVTREKYDNLTSKRCQKMKNISFLPKQEFNISLAGASGDSRQAVNLGLSLLGIRFFSGVKENKRNIVVQTSCMKIIRKVLHGRETPVG